MRPQTVRSLVATCLTVVNTTTSSVVAQVPDSPASRAFRFFEALPPGDARTALAAFRPAPIAVADRARALATLPAEGELRPDAAEARKLASLESVLSYHDRLGVLVIKVIDVPQAAIGLCARSILLLSRHALRIVSADELQALVAHEMGHDFFWADHDRARARGDTQALQEVELKCDGIAALTMASLGLDADVLGSGVRKVTHANEAIGATANASGYPDLVERARFVREVLALRSGQTVRR